MNIQNDLAQEMKDLDFTAEEIKVACADLEMLKFIAHLIQTGEAKNVYELFGDTGFVEGLEQQLIDPITFDEMVGE